jgi:protocatechuate 3,4-dioxygenase beta subunit
MPLLVALGLAGALIQTSAATDGAVVSGRVLEQGTQAPVTGAQVVLMAQLQNPPPGPFRYRPNTATTDENGRFEFVDIEPGRYRLTAQKAGFALPDDGNVSLSLELTRGDRRDDVALTLQRGAVITGRVIDQYGEPVVDAQVMVLRKPPAPSTPSSPAGVAAARFANRLMPAGPGAQTNDLGEFRLHSLLPGEYYVQAAPRGDFGGNPAANTRAAATTMVPTYFPGASDPQAAQPILVTAGQTASDVEVRMAVASVFQVSGVVVDEAGQPVTNAMVRLMPQDATVPQSIMLRPFNQARTDARGTFSFGNVTNGAYTLIAVPPLVIAGEPRGPAGVGGGFTSFSSGGSIAAGSTGGAVMTESSDGTTVQYRDDAGTQVPVVVNEGSVPDLQVVVGRPSP